MVDMYVIRVEQTVMVEPTSFESDALHPQEYPQAAPTRSARRWVLVGFLLGAAIPLGLGTFSIYSDTIYCASLPADKRIMCGMGSLAATMIMMFGAPTLGGIGAVVGLGLSKLPRLR